MKKTGISALFTLLSLLCAMSSAQEQVSAPVYQDGDFWQFKIDRSNYTSPASQSNLLHGIYEVSFSNGDFKTYELRGTEKIEFVDTLGMLHGMFGKGEWHGGHLLSFPLSVGKKWNFEYVAPLAGARDPRRWKVESSVTAWEAVVTSIANLEAFKIENKQLSGRTSAVPVTIIFYYSPKTKSIIKLSFVGRTGSGSGGKADIDVIKFSSSSKP
jgi:hypothetical protein